MVQRRPKCRTIRFPPALNLDVFGRQLALPTVEISQHRGTLGINAKAGSPLSIGADAQIGNKAATRHVAFHPQRTLRM